MVVGLSNLADSWISEFAQVVDEDGMSHTVSFIHFTCCSG
jgi:hypothetical protein